MLPSFPPTPIRPLTADEIGTRGGGARVFRGMFVADFVHLARHVESTDLPTILSRLFPFSSGSRSNLQFYSVFSFSIRPIPYDRPPTHPLKGPSRSRSSYIPFPPLFPPSPLPILFSITSTFLSLPGKRKRACLSFGSIKLFIPSAGIITTVNFSRQFQLFTRLDPRRFPLLGKEGRNVDRIGKKSRETKDWILEGRRN